MTEVLFSKSRPLWCVLLTISISVITLMSVLQVQAATAEEPPELATYMGELQRLTHKLSLSAAAGNIELSRFYMHESLHILTEIQEDIPEYEDIAVAILIDRMSLPAYSQLQAVLAKKTVKAAAISKAVDGIVEGCNNCHEATRFGFIKIKNSQHNPFNQDFNP